MKSYKKKLHKIKWNDFINKIEKSNVIKYLTYSKDSKEYKKTSDTLEKLKINCTVEGLTIHKITIAFITLIMLVSLNEYTLSKKKNEIINPISFKDGRISTNLTQTNDDNTTLLARKIITTTPNYKQLVKSGDYQTIANKIVKMESQMAIIDPSHSIAKETLTKIITVANMKTSPMVIMTIILLSIISIKFVDIDLKIKELIYKSKVDKEFKRIERLTILLIKNSSFTVEQILFKQMEYTNCLKPYYDLCLKEYSIDNIKAIQNLIKNVNNKEFTRFMLLLQQNFIGSRTVNIRLMETEKDRIAKVEGQMYIKKLKKISGVLVIASFLFWIVDFLIFMMPLMIYISKSII